MRSGGLLTLERQLHVEAVRTAPEFAAFRGVEVTLDEACFTRPALLGFYVRHALEEAWLEGRGIAPALARLAAARPAAQFLHAEMAWLSPADREAAPAWVAAMAGDVAPAVKEMARYFDATPAEMAQVRGIWPFLGTAESLMETGGDIRLARDPKTALNGYGCSHRPRPWAVTFASSTASSSSERGYEAADRARLRTSLQLLRGAGRRAAVREALNAVRRGIAKAFGLPEGAKIILAASGTDTELLALAVTHLGGEDAPILNILIAPEETGRGVPMAARGLHFSVDTALGHDVTFEAPIEGFRADTALANVALRGADGALRDASEVEAEIFEAVRGGIAAGARVILHALDLSKTGLLAPGPGFLAGLRAAFGDKFDIVVDACQARLSAASLNAYLALEAMVLVTGSKFFTGPPFAGAAILPAGIAARLGRGRLPAGLDAYFGQDDFYAGARSAAGLPAVGNLGLALRWHAALAEIRALYRVPAGRRAEIIAGFGAAVRRAVARFPAVALLDAPEIVRTVEAEDWEKLPTIFTFSLRSPDAPERCLTPGEARAVYFWLNTDLSAVLPGEARVAARICHIGQPVPLPQAGGALRVSAGARLISGEPSHKGLKREARLRREFADLETVFEKIDLILRHWALLHMANPAPCFRQEISSAFFEKKLLRVESTDSRI